MTPKERASEIVYGEWKPFPLPPGNWLHTREFVCERLAVDIEAAIAAAIAEERVACAKLARELPFRDCQMDDCRSEDIAAAIRARGDCAPAVERTPLFRTGVFALHSGEMSPWKIDCDALADDDFATLARMLADVLPCSFGTVEGVPRGGLRWARALEKFARPGGGLLIVDDVLTTGGSMEGLRAGRDAMGAVIFARGPVPSWVVPLFVYLGAAH